MNKTLYQQQEYLKKFINSCNSRKPLCLDYQYPHHIITKDRDKAIKFMKQKNATPIAIGKKYCEWRLNEEIWVWKQYNQRERGIRFFQIVIDKDIDFEFLDWVMIASYYCFSAEAF